MIFPIPLAIIFGILTIICLFFTAGFGIATHIFRKNVFKFHMILAFTTVTLAIIHFILAYLLFFVGIVL